MEETQVITSGAVFTLTYPFVRELASLIDEDGPYEVLCWRPGCHKGQTTADGEGLQVLLVIATATLGGRYQDRVFYVQQWQDPQGKRFGKMQVRCCGLRKFRRMIQGYGYAYSLPGHPTVEERERAEEEAWTHYCGRCGKGLNEHDGPFAYCEPCQATKTCPHGVRYKEECNACNVLSDLAYDAMRESR